MRSEIPAERAALGVLIWGLAIGFFSGIAVCGLILAVVGK